MSVGGLFRKKAKKESVEEFLEAHNFKCLADVLNHRDHEARDFVLEFCEEKLVVESALFYLDNVRFQHQKNLVEAAKLARKLLEEYIQPEAPLELNLPEASKKNIQKMIQDAMLKSADYLAATYKRANDEVINMLEAYWPEFIKSKFVADLQEELAALEDHRDEAAREADKAAAKMSRPPPKAPPEPDWRQQGPSEVEKRLKRTALESALNSEFGSLATSLAGFTLADAAAADTSSPRTEDEKRRRTAPSKSSDASADDSSRRHRKSKGHSSSSSSSSRDPAPANSSSSSSSASKKDKDKDRDNKSEKSSSSDRKKTSSSMSSSTSTASKSISFADLNNL